MKNYFLVILAICIASSVAAQTTNISGTILEKNTGSVLIGANVLIQNTQEGTISRHDGSFAIETSLSLPIRLVISMIGFQSHEIDIRGNTSGLEIYLEDQVYLGEEVIISASRIPENIMKSPVSIEKLSALDIQQTSTANFFDGLHQLKGVDMNVHSLTFRSKHQRFYW